MMTTLSGDNSEAELQFDKPHRSLEKCTGLLTLVDVDVHETRCEVDR